MLALFNETPRHCPQCGCDLRWDNFSRQDFYAGASHTCRECGLHYAYVAGPTLLKVASETGDLGRYVTVADLD